MKRYFRVIVVILIMDCVIFGKDSLHTENRWALQFGITDNFSLSSFQGSNVSLKYNLRKNRSIRLGLSLNGNQNNKKEYNIRTGTDEIKSNAFNITVCTLYMYSKQMNNQRVLQFVGFGPLLGYSYSISKNKDSSVFGPNMEDVNKIFTVGITSQIGTEIFITDWLSLEAQYGTSISYQNNYEQYTVKTRNDVEDDFIISTKLKVTENNYILNASSVIFGLSIYFQ